MYLQAVQRFLAATPARYILLPATKHQKPNTNKP